MRRPTPTSVLILASAILVAACAASGDPTAPGNAAASAPEPTAVGAAPGAGPPGTGSDAGTGAFEVVEYDVRPGSHPHDVAPAADGGVWYTGQQNGTLGHLDPATGTVSEIVLGDTSRPHGVIVGPDGLPWITDGGLNAIVRVDPRPRHHRRLPAAARVPERQPEHRDLRRRRRPVVHRARPACTGGSTRTSARSRRSRRRAGPARTASRRRPTARSGIASLAGSYLGRIDRATGEATVIEPPTPGQGARRVWSDPGGRLFISEWNAGQVGMHDPADGSWREWRLPGDGQPQPYAVYVDDAGIAWLTDFAANAIVRFDPASESFTSIPRAHRGRRRSPAARPAGRGVGRRIGHGQARPRPELTASSGASPGGRRRTRRRAPRAGRGRAGRA